MALQRARGRGELGTALAAGFRYRHPLRETGGHEGVTPDLVRSGPARGVVERVRRARVRGAAAPPSWTQPAHLHRGVRRQGAAAAQAVGSGPPPVSTYQFVALILVVIGPVLALARSTGAPPSSF